MTAAATIALRVLKEHKNDKETVGGYPAEPEQANP